MKCLCCNQSFANQFHNVDENNHLFRKLFMRNNNFVPRKCFCCDCFCINRRDEKNHNFLAHYQLGGRQPTEDKYLKKTFFDENSKRYCINFLKHGTFYNFYNSREAVSEFLTVFYNNYTPNADLRQSRFKCSFMIINQQTAPRDGFAEITDSRIWQTNVYEGVYFNNFIKSNLANDILKRAIMNGMFRQRLEI